MNANGTSRQFCTTPSLLSFSLGPEIVLIDHSVFTAALTVPRIVYTGGETRRAALCRDNDASVAEEMERFRIHMCSIARSL